MAGRTLAEALVRIRPDTKGFEAELKKQLADVKVDTPANKAGKAWGAAFAKAAVAQAKATLSTTKITIPVEFSNAKFSTPRTGSVKVGVDVDTAKAEADLKAWVARVSGKHTIHIPIVFTNGGVAGGNSPIFATAGQNAALTYGGSFQRAIGPAVQASRPTITRAVTTAGGGTLQAGIRAGLGWAKGFAANIAGAGFGKIFAQLGTNIVTGINPLKWLEIPSAVGASVKLIAASFKDLWDNVKSVGNAAQAVGPAIANALSGTATAGAQTVAASMTALAGALVDAVPAAFAAGGALALLPALIAAILATAGAAAVAVNVLGGALATLPALGIGLGAGLGTLSLGFSGLSEHLKKVAGSGGGAAKSLSGIRTATYAVTVAQREYVKSALAVNIARADEVKRIEDLRRSLAGSALDEEAAANAVADARTALADARATGDVNQIGKADLAYRQSLQTLDEAKAKTADLSAQKADADRKGVEGSDAVQQALQNQQDALERLQQAQASLLDAQKSAGASAAAQALQKIAPAAQQVVDELKKLKPAFDNLRLDVQQRLFAGIAPILDKLAHTWFPPLHKILGETADGFNGLFKQLAVSISKPQFISDIEAAFENVKSGMDEIGAAVVGPLVGAFGTLARASGPVVKEIADEITKVVTGFSDWIASADKSGALKKFMKDAARYLHEIFVDGGLVVDIAGQIIGIFLDSRTKGGAKPILESIHDRLQSISDWLKDPKHQQQIKEFIDKVGDLIGKMKELIDWLVKKGIPDVEKFIGKVKEWVDKVGGWIDAVKGWKNTITSTFDSIVASIGGLGGRISNAASGMWYGIYNSFRTMINGVIDAWDSLYFTPKVAKIQAAKGSGAGIAGAISIPHLASGGIVQARPGGTTIQVAEAGQDEAVTPIETLKAMVRETVRDVAGQGGGDIIIPVYVGQEHIDTIVVKAVDRQKTVVARSVNAGNKKLGFAG